MNRKRERSEIIFDILSAIRIRGEAKPTHILYKSNLSHTMLRDYLAELMEKGFVTEEQDKKGRKRYLLTEKAYGYLKDFNVIRSFIESYGLD